MWQYYNMHRLIINKQFSKGTELLTHILGRLKVLTHDTVASAMSEQGRSPHAHTQIQKDSHAYLTDILTRLKEDEEE